MNKIVGRRLLNLGAGLAAVILGTGAAHATYMVKSAGIDGSVGSLSGTINYTPGGISEGALVGRILLTGTNTDTGASFSWTSYCVDIQDYLHTGDFTAAPISALKLSDAKLLQLNALVSHADGMVKDAASSAAVQLAVWEIVDEGSGYDLSKGAFSVTNIDAGAISSANTMLGNITTGAWAPTAGFNMALVTSPGNQTQLIFGPNTPAVPEPASWATMIAGFGLVGAGLRRRRTKVAFAA